MRHLVFFLYSISFAVGVSAVGLLFYVSRWSKTKLIKYSAFFLISLTAHFFSYTLLYYIMINVIDRSLLVNIILIITFSLGGIPLLNFAPLLAYNASGINFLKKYKLVYGTLSIILFFLYILYFFNVEKNIVLVAVNVLIFVVMSNCIRILIKYLKNEKNVIVFKIKKVFLNIAAAFFPILIICSYIKINIVSSKNFFNIDIVFPIFFLIFNMFNISFVFKYFSLKKCEQNITISDLFIQKYNITKRQYQIISLLIKGNSYDEIANQLVIAMPTVKTHITNIYKKIGIKNKIELLNAIKECN